MAGPEPDRRRSPLVLAAVMVGAGALHFVIPSTYERMVPRPLGHARALVLLSGVAEIGCGLLLARPRTRRLGGWLTAGLLVAVFPANVQLALDAGAPTGVGPAVAWLRLPLQVPLVAWALRQVRSPAPPGRR